MWLPIDHWKFWWIKRPVVKSLKSIPHSHKYPIILNISIQMLFFYPDNLSFYFDGFLFSILMVSSLSWWFPLLHISWWFPLYPDGFLSFILIVYLSILMVSYSITRESLSIHADLSLYPDGFLSILMVSSLFWWFPLYSDGLSLYLDGLSLDPDGFLSILMVSSSLSWWFISLSWWFPLMYPDGLSLYSDGFLLHYTRIPLDPCRFISLSW